MALAPWQKGGHDVSPLRIQGGLGVTQVLTTSDKKPAERLEFWQEVVCKKYVSAAATTDLRNEDFEASLVSRELGPLVVAELTAPLHFWSRRASHLRHDGQDVYIVSLIRSGGGELRQRGRSARLAEGDLVLYDSAAPFDYALHASTQLVKIPKPLLDCKLGDATDLIAVKVDGGNALAPVLSDLLARSLKLDIADDAGTVAAKRVSNAIVEVVASICDLRREAISASNCSQPLERVMRYARAHLDTGGLNPERLAAAGAMSVRTLNRLFGAFGATPMRWVWAQRLEASRAALAQGQVATVTEAALAHGFSDLAHFSRSFKKAYGVAPHRLLKR